MTKISHSPSARHLVDTGTQSFKDTVFLAATELFAARTHPQPHEIRVYRELGLNLFEDTSDDDLVQIARLLAPCKDAPKEIIEHLAGSLNPLIAYPVLKIAAGLSTEVLGTAVLRGPDSLRRAVAARPDLPQPLAELIAEVGEVPSVRVLLEREDIALSDKAAGQLCARADIMESLGDLAAARIRMTGELAARHFLNMPAAERREAVATAELKVLVDRAQGASTRTAAHLPPDGLLTRALARDSAGTALELATALGVSHALAERILADRGGEPLMICLKQIGFAVQDATSIVIALGGPELKLIPLRNLVDLFESLSVAAASHLTARWAGQRPEVRSGNLEKPALEQEALETAARTRAALEARGLDSWTADGPTSSVRHVPQYQDTGQRRATAPLSDVEDALEAFKKLAS